jgi:hypothetical protein
MTDIVRVLRILEYLGPADWVRITLEKGAIPENGVRRFADNRCIRSEIIGESTEPLEKLNGQ